MSIVPCFDPTSGASGGPAPTGGGGEDQAFTFADGTVIGSGFQAGSSSDTIRMDVANGQAAADVLSAKQSRSGLFESRMGDQSGPCKLACRCCGCETDQRSDGVV